MTTASLPDEEYRLLTTYADGPRIWDAAHLWAIVQRLADRGYIRETTREAGDRDGAYELTDTGRAFLGG